MEKPDAGGGKLHVLKNENSSTDKRKTIMALIVYNRENSRPQEVTYKGKRTINLDSRGTVYLSKTMSIELGILGGGRVNFAHDDETGDWYICRADDSEGFIVWKDKRCARFSAVYRAEAHAAGEGGEEERAVHDGEDAGRDWRGGLLQDTALESDTQIEAWAGVVRLYMT